MAGVWSATRVIAMMVMVVLRCGRCAEDRTGLQEAVRTLEGQVSALLQRRSDDFKLLEESLRSSLEKSSELSTLRTEVDSLRREVERLRGPSPGNQLRNDHLTVQWLATAVGELRAELTEVARAQNASADLQQRQEVAAGMALLRGDVASVRRDMDELRAEQQRGAASLGQLQQDVEAARQRGQTAAAVCAEAKAQVDSAQSDWMSAIKTLKRSMGAKKHAKRDGHHTHHGHNVESNELMPAANDVEAPRTRHQRMLRRQVDALERQVRRLDQLGTRVAKLESSSGKSAGVDKLHLSVLQLLESVETLENKVDHALPDVQREVSKMEFGLAQLQSAVAVVREDQDNQRLSVKALAGGQSALQDKLDNDHARLGALQSQILNLTLETNSSYPESDSDTDSEQDSRLGALEQRLLRLQAVPALQAAWTPLNESEASPNSSTSVPGLIRALGLVQQDYQRIIHRLPTDCGSVVGPSGLYLISPGLDGGRPLVTSCDQDTSAGGWTVVQRRVDGSQDFNRKWNEYAEGFGSPSGEFWLGNEALHRLTIANCSSLRVDLRDIYGKVWAAEYSEFSVSSAKDGYRLHVGGYRGNASDALDYQNHMQFSAIDSDRDISNTHCAANYEGGWWFSHCQHANLNGRYNLGLTWFDGAKNEWIAVAWSEMKVRRRNTCS